MPSSYTTLLKFELPVQGELSGTWGNVVNTAITTPISQAIAGTTSINVGATDYTLTNGDGSTPNEARHMFITAIGSPGAARNVICPATSKLYVFTNSTSGGFAMTLKTPSGSGIAVPAGQSRLLYCNGTDVVEAVNGFGSISLTTALAATSGGTGQSSFAVGDLLYASSTTAISKLTVGATNAVLTVAAGIPSWVATLPAVSGGTGLSSPGTAGNVLSSAGATWQSVAVSTLVPAATDTVSGVVELATNAEALAGTDTTRAITPASMRAGFSASGSAPVFACRAWINFHGVPTGGTYSRSGTLVTVTMTNHGMSTGMVANLTFSAGTGGTATSGSYPITSTGASSFTITDTVSGTITGSPSVTRNNYIRASGNVASLVSQATGIYSVFFETNMPDGYYTVSGSGQSGIGGYAIVQIDGVGVPGASSCRIGTVTQQSGAPAGYDFEYVTAVFVR